MEQLCGLWQRNCRYPLSRESNVNFIQAFYEFTAPGTEHSLFTLSSAHPDDFLQRIVVLLPQESKSIWKSFDLSEFKIFWFIYNC